MRQDFKELQAVAQGAYNENGFCTVAALALCLDWSFGKAHRHMKKHGRLNRRGMHWTVWLPALKDAATKAGKDVKRVQQYDGLTLNRFCKQRVKGTFYVKVNRHALCIRDGIIHDWTADTAGRRKIQMLFKIED